MSNEDEWKTEGDSVIGREIYVSSDLHLGHANILTFKGADGNLIRPEFSSVEEMDETIIERHNKVVRPNDIWYCGGDVAFGPGRKLIERLNGRKRLILGNHDNGKDQYLQKAFQKILMWRQFPELNCLITHVPVHSSSLFKVKYNIHGHIHEKVVVDSFIGEPDPQYINVSVERINYTPVALEDIIPKD